MGLLAGGKGMVLFDVGGPLPAGTSVNFQKLPPLWWHHLQKGDKSHLKSHFVSELMDDGRFCKFGKLLETFQRVDLRPHKF